MKKSVVFAGMKKDPKKGMMKLKTAAATKKTAPAAKKTAGVEKSAKTKSAGTKRDVSKKAGGKKKLAAAAKAKRKPVSKFDSMLAKMRAPQDSAFWKSMLEWNKK